MSLSRLKRARVFGAVFFLASALGSRASAEPRTKDLGQGLSYLRFASLPADLPASGTEPKGALVIDIRGAGADRPGTKAFSAWLGFHGTGEYPIFVLANQDTAPALKKAVQGADCAALLTLAPSDSDVAADIGVDTTQAADRDAYEALGKGEPLESLLSMTQEKERLDEAKLSQDYENGYRPQSHEPPPSSKGDAETEAAKPRRLDLVLARAVQIHKALLILGRQP